MTRLGLCALLLASACASGSSDSADARGPDEPLDCGALTQCDRECADLATDPGNCGACGRTCVIANAVAGCAARECVIASCEDGFFDADNDPITGCEVEDSCVPDTSCTNECGTTGATVCTDGVASCASLPEQCNAVDDDCNGQCDEGALAGCRLGVHRSSGNGHLYTTDLAVASMAPYNLEAENYFRIYTNEAAGTQPLFLCQKPGSKFFLTSSTNCEGVGAPRALLGYWSPTEICGATPLHRLYHAPSDNHFYTLNAGERDNAINNLGYTSEGVGGYVWTAP